MGILVQVTVVCMMMVVITNATSIKIFSFHRVFSCSFVGRLFDQRSRDANAAAAAAARSSSKDKAHFARVRAMSLGQLKVRLCVLSGGR